MVKKFKGHFTKNNFKKTNQMIYRIDRIIRRRGDSVVIKWSGYPDKFNSWLNKEAVQQSGEEI